MEQQLAEVRDRLQFRLQVVDIDKNPELVEKYNELVPVLAGEDGEICHHFLDLVALERYLQQC